jgi:hypothetical protein
LSWSRRELELSLLNRFKIPFGSEDMDKNTKTRKRAANHVSQQGVDFIFKALKYFENEYELYKQGEMPNFHAFNVRAAELTGWTVSEIEKLKNDACSVPMNLFLNAGEKQERARPMEIETIPGAADFWAAKIRDLLRYGYVYLDRWPTFGWIFAEIQKIPNQTRASGFNWSEPTLRRFMSKHGFSMEQRKSYYDNIREKESTLALRDEYALQIHEYREQGLDIYFEDETWGSQNLDRHGGWSWEGDYDEEGEWINEQAVHPPPETAVNSGTDNCHQYI